MERRRGLRARPCRRGRYLFKLLYPRRMRKPLFRRLGNAEGREQTGGGSVYQLPLYARKRGAQFVFYRLHLGDRGRRNTELCGRNIRRGRRQRNRRMVRFKLLFRRRSRALRRRRTAEPPVVRAVPARRSDPPLRRYGLLRRKRSARKRTVDESERRLARRLGDRSHLRGRCGNRRVCRVCKVGRQNRLLPP